MSYACKVLADSVNPVGHRLTTFEITFPRFILAELNTHRMLSRNSASSRAIPTEKTIQRVKDDPFVPEFNARVTGMGVGEPLGDRDLKLAQDAWIASRDAAVIAAEAMRFVDKSRANRLLEPFLWHTAIVTATEWDNFYALRDHEAAQPEFRTLAMLMRAEHVYSEPDQLDWGQWHLPLWSDEDSTSTWSDIRSTPFPAEVSAGRCARVSYDRHNDDEELIDSAARWLKLSSVGHWSPGENPARSLTEEEWDAIQARQEHEERRSLLEDGVPASQSTLGAMELVGNFRGFVQLRKHYPGEAVFRG